MMLNNEKIPAYFMNTLSKYFKNPFCWATLFFISAGVLIIGWAFSYPILNLPVEQAFFSQVSPLFWVGLCLSLIALAGLVETVQSPLVPWLASIALVILITSPQLLYIAYGSDAGMLVAMADYTKTVGDFNLVRDASVVSYSQWPTSIFYNRFLSDLFFVDTYSAVSLGFVLVSICVAVGLYLLWSKGGNQSITARAAFWGILVYFAGFYWFFNWQAAPYTFALALFLPGLALLEKKDPRFRLLLFMLLVPGMEAHALYGVWMILITVCFFIFSFFFKKEHHWITSTVIILIFVSQITLIIYKNVRFFNFIALSIRGYYQALLETGASDRAIAIQATNALTQAPLDPLGQLLKVLAYIDLAFIFFAFVIAFFIILTNRKLKVREISFFTAGFIYFIIGIFLAAIGTRSLQIIALVPAFFVVDSLVHPGKASRTVLIACFIGLILFPSTIFRSHQTGSNMVRPLDLPVKNFTTYVRPDLIGNNLILVEGVRPIDIMLIHQVLSPSTVKFIKTCNGTYTIMKTTGLEFKVNQIFNNSTKTPSMSERGDGFNEVALNKVYDIGEVSLLLGQDCNVLLNLFK